MAIVYTVIGFLGVMVLGPLVALLVLNLDDVDEYAVEEEAE